MEKFETSPDSPPITVNDPDDQPMWSSTRTVTPTPSSAIVQLPISDNFHINEEAVMLRSFPFSLSEEAKTCFHQLGNETLVDAWLRIKEMLCICYEHGLTKGTIIRIFNHGLDDPTQGILDAGGIFLYNTPNKAFEILEDKVLLKLNFSDIVTKIDSEFLIMRKELKEMQDGHRDNHALQIYMKDDTLMCEPHEANYVQRYHGGYHDHEPINSYSYPNHNSHPSRYFEFTETSMEEMMREWMASQTKANERMKNQVVELENQINQGLRNHQAIIQNLERQFEFLLPTKTLPLATNTKPRHEIVYNIPSIQNDNDKGDVKFIMEEEIEPNPTMPNPNLIMSNSPTVSPFLKDCTVHIPYTQEKVFEQDEISNHVGDKELISFVGIGNEVSKGNIEDMENPKRPNVSHSLVEYIPKISYPQALKREISHFNRIIKES
ncbi:hypothetical protein Tco_1272588 [Tanacetum coccineum]